MRLIETSLGNFYSPDDPGESCYPNAVPRHSVTKQEAKLLMEFAEGKKVLEIGTGLGISTRAMAAKAKEVVSVDIDDWCHQHEFPANVRLMKEVPDEEFDFAFIDGDHRYEAVKADIARTRAKVIALHDCDHPDVVRALVDSDLKVIKAYPTVCQLTICER